MSWQLLDVYKRQIHSEAYASGELKHGTISLIEEGTLVVALGTYAKLFEKAMSNIVEVKARGGDVLALTTREPVSYTHLDVYKRQLQQNHLYTMTANRGVKASEAVTLLVRGSYTIG